MLAFFAAAAEEALGFPAELLLWLLPLVLLLLAAVVLVVADRLYGVCVGAGLEAVLDLALVVAALRASNGSVCVGSAATARRRPRLPLSLNGRTADDIIRVMVEVKGCGSGGQIVAYRSR